MPVVLHKLPYSLFTIATLQKLFDQWVESCGSAYRFIALYFDVEYNHDHSIHPYNFLYSAPSFKLSDFLNFFEALRFQNLPDGCIYAEIHPSRRRILRFPNLSRGVLDGMCYYFGAGSGVRTRDLLFGKQVLYH